MIRRVWQATRIIVNRVRFDSNGQNLVRRWFCYSSIIEISQILPITKYIFSLLSQNPTKRAFSPSMTNESIGPWWPMQLRYWLVCAPIAAKQLYSDSRRIFDRPSVQKSNLFSIPYLYSFRHLYGVLHNRFLSVRRIRLNDLSTNLGRTESLQACETK